MAQEIELLPPLAMSTSITADQIRQDRDLDKVLQCRHGRREAALVATADQACIGHHLCGEYVPSVEYALRVTRKAGTGTRSKYVRAETIFSGMSSTVSIIPNLFGLPRLVCQMEHRQ